MPIISRKDADLVRAIGVDLADALEEPVTYRRYRGLLPPDPEQDVQQLPDYEITNITAQVDLISMDTVFKSAGAYSPGDLEVSIRQGVWPAVDAALQAARVGGTQDTLAIAGHNYRVKLVDAFSLFRSVLAWELKVGRL